MEKSTFYKLDDVIGHPCPFMTMFLPGFPLRGIQKQNAVYVESPS